MRGILKKIPENSVYAMIASPVGTLCLMASERGLHAVFWEKEIGALAPALAELKCDADHPVLHQTIKQLDEYFAGDRRAFDVKLAPSGSEFQLKAWQELRGIPYGKTISYGEQARRIGDPKASRAVGTANGRNPLSIIVPCHRVIAANGALTGFGGGIEAKKYLLSLEGAAFSE